jgi:hypothetical protein
MFAKATLLKLCSNTGLISNKIQRNQSSGLEGNFLVTEFEVGGSFGLSLEGDCHEVEVTPSLELLVTFGISL